MDNAGFLRRVSLDLTGQVPTPEEARAFVADGMEVKKVNEVPMSAMWTQRPGVNEPQYGYNADDRESGSVAAPTAGLHFTDKLLAQLNERGVKRAEIILHVTTDAPLPRPPGTKPGAIAPNGICTAQDPDAAPLFDSVRAVAVLLIMVFHVASITGSVNRAVLGDVLTILGNQAPIVFFVISGFLLYRPFVAAHAHGSAGPSGLARFFGRLVRRTRLEHKIYTPPHLALGHLSAKQRSAAGQP